MNDNPLDESPTPPLVAASREELIEAMRSVWGLAMVNADGGGDGAPGVLADALLAPGGPVQVVEATLEQVWYLGYAALTDTPNPYVGNSRKEQGQ